MGKIYYKNQEYTGSNGGGGDVPSSDIPTANTISKFDNSAKMNSTDMTSTEITNFVNSLDANGSNLVDYVVEQGTSDIWTYRKWNSGIAECWGKYVYSTSTSSVWVSPIYVTTPVDRQNYPFTFTSVPNEQVNAFASNNALWLYAESGDAMNTTIQTGYYRPTKVNDFSGTQTITVNYYVIGRWK